MQRVCGIRYLTSCIRYSFSETDYQTQLKTLNLPLRLLVDNEVYRLNVWTNPANDLKRGTDHVNTVEKVMTDVRAPRFLIVLFLIVLCIAGWLGRCIAHLVEN